MSEPGDIRVVPQEDTSPPQASLAALRRAGAQTFDPVRFRYLEVLSQRLQDVPVEVQRVLQGRLQAALTDYDERFRQAPQTDRGAPAARTPPDSPLRALTQYIAQATQDLGEAPLGQEMAGRSDMKSLRRFRETWSRISAEDQLNKAIGRAPDKAGPLNSHLLVLRALTMMRELSPDYLRRFLSHLDALLWLDQANQKYSLAEARPVRRTRPKK